MGIFWLEMNRKLSKAPKNRILDHPWPYNVAKTSSTLSAKKFQNHFFGLFSPVMDAESKITPWKTIWDDFRGVCRVQGPKNVKSSFQRTIATGAPVFLFKPKDTELYEVSCLSVSWEQPLWFKNDNSPFLRPSSDLQFRPLGPPNCKRGRLGNSWERKSVCVCVCVRERERYNPITSLYLPSIKN